MSTAVTTDRSPEAVTAYLRGRGWVARSLLRTAVWGGLPDGKRGENLHGTVRRLLQAGVLECRGGTKGPFEVRLKQTPPRSTP